MCRSRAIQVRVTPSQYDRIKNRMEGLGYIKLSDFLRDVLLKDDFFTYKLIREIHQKIMGEGRYGKTKNCIQGRQVN